MAVIDITNKCTITPESGVMVSSDPHYAYHYVNIVYNDGNNTFEQSLYINAVNRSMFNAPYNFSNMANSNCHAYFRDCINFNAPVRISESVIDFSDIFLNCTNFNSNITFYGSTHNVSSLKIFNNCPNYNQDLTFPDIIKYNASREGLSSNWSIESLFGLSNEYSKNLYIGNNIAGDFNNLCNSGTSNRYINFNASVYIGDNINACDNMFRNCYSLNKPIRIGKGAFNCASMFYGCYKFNSSVDITSNNVNCYSMFSGCSNFNQPINIPANSNCMYMFENCYKFNKPLVIPENTVCGQIISRCNSFNSNITLLPNAIYGSLGYHTAEGNNMYSANIIFSEGWLEINKALAGRYDDFNAQIILPNGLLTITNLINRSNTYNRPINIPNGVINCHSLFVYCNNLNSKVNIPNTVTNAYNMFYHCSNFNQPVNIPTSLVDGSRMFAYCDKLFNQPITLYNNLINCFEMFNTCDESFNQSVNIPESVKDCGGMFLWCKSLNKPIGIPNTITNTYRLFMGCSIFNQPVNISDNVVECCNMFYSCSAFNQSINIPSKVTNCSGILGLCNSYNQDSLNINSENINNSLYMLSTRATIENDVGPYINNIYIRSLNFNTYGMFSSFNETYTKSRPHRINIYCKNFNYLYDIDNICMTYNYTQAMAGNMVADPNLIPTWNTDISGCMYNSDFNIYIYNNLI